MRPSRFQIAIALAIGAHAMAWRIQPVAPPPLSRAEVVVLEEPSVDVELVADPTADVDRDLLAPTSLGRGGARSLEPRSRGDRAATTDHVEPPPQPDDGSPVASLWTVDPATQRDIGLRGTRTFATAPPPASDADLVRDRAQRSIADSLRDGELAAGDTTSGPIVRALQDSTRQSVAPVNGHATFDAVIDAGGFLVSIGTVDATSGREGWDGVAKASAGSLVGHKLRTSKRGLVVRIEITSREQLPSGSRGGVGGDVLGDGTGQQPHALDVHVLPYAPSHDGAWGKKEDFTPLTGSFDVSDIGSHGQRVVGARVTSVRDL